MNPFRWQEAVNPLKIRLIDRWVVGARVVDVGCGTGVYAAHLRQAGLRVAALDVEKRLMNGHRIGFTLAKAPFLPLANKCCDTMILFDVLEHVDDDDEFLREAGRITRKRLILSVPADDDRDLPKFGLCLLHHIDKTHRREYSTETLGATLARSGFRVVHIEPAYPESVPFVVGMFFSRSSVGRLMRIMTLAWLSLLRSAGILQVDLPADWLAVADLREE